MILIDHILVSEDVFSQQFTCNLSACKGACCWEGDWGAPLEKEEISLLSEIRERLRPHLTDAGNQVIDREGSSIFYEAIQGEGTPLIEGAACAYLTFDEQGVGKCGIELAHEKGSVDFRKPISCHLYPIRHTKIDHVDFEALNYESWDICQEACRLGSELEMPVYRFVKDALIRKFGIDFYDKMDQIARDYPKD